MLRKRFLALLLCALLLLPIIACGGTDVTTTPAVTTDPSMTTTTEPTPPRRPEVTTPAQDKIIATPAPGDYDFCDNAAVDGMITLTGLTPYLKNALGTLWNGKNDDSWKNRIRTGTYLFLPEGSTLTCDTNQMALCFFNNDFQWQPGWYTLEKFSDGKNAAWMTGTCTVPRDCFVRYTIVDNTLNADSTQAQIDEVSEKMIIQVPKDRINEVYAHDLMDPVQKVYHDEMQATLGTLGEVVADGAVNYIFITDLHAGSNNAAVTRQLSSVISMVNTLAEDNDPANDIDFVALGGDLSTGMYKNTDAYMDALDKLLAPLNYCKVPVVIARGNHDDNSYYYQFTLTPEHFDNNQKRQEYLDKNAMNSERWYDYMLFHFANDDNTAENPTHSRVHDSRRPKSGYYYLDLTGKKTRVVCLDAIHTKYLSPQENGCSYWGYAVDQLHWLIDQALTAPAGWNYIFISHMGYEADLMKPPTTYHSAYKNFDVLEGILTAFQTKTAYESSLSDTYWEDGVAKKFKIACDYTDRPGDGMILAYSYGHHHADDRHYNVKTAIPTMTIGTAGQYDPTASWKLEPIGQNDGVVLERRNETTSEALFDVVCATPSQVTAIRFGAGSDRFFTLSAPGTGEDNLEDSSEPGSGGKLTIKDLTDSKIAELKQLAASGEVIVSISGDASELTASVAEKLTALEEAGVTVALDLDVSDLIGYDPEALAKTAVLNKGYWGINNLSVTLTSGIATTVPVELPAGVTVYSKAAVRLFFVNETASPYTLDQAMMQKLRADAEEKGIAMKNNGTDMTYTAKYSFQVAQACKLIFSMEYIFAADITADTAQAALETVSFRYRGELSDYQAWIGSLSD